MKIPFCSNHSHWFKIIRLVTIVDNICGVQIFEMPVLKWSSEFITWFLSAASWAVSFLFTAAFLYWFIKCRFLWTFSSASTFVEIIGVLMKEYLLISRLIMKHGMFELWHLDNLVLAMQYLQLTIANLCQIQFESQMSMILCLICLHIILISLKRRTTTSQERYAFANWSDDYLSPYYLFVVCFICSQTYFFILGVALQHWIRESCL